MLRTAFVLTAGLLSAALAASNSLTVWLPEQGQTATLSSQGLTAADGGRIVLNRPAYDLPFERPISGGFVRLSPAGKTGPARLEVVQGGKVTASRTFPEARYGARLQGTERGPCVSSTETDSDKSITRCFAPDLKTEWVKLPGQPFLSASGKVAYTVLTDWKLEKPAGDDVDVIRRDLNTGEEVTLSYRVPLPGQTLVVPSGMSDPIDRRATLGLAAELPGERYLVCASTTIPKDPCRLDIVDRDFKKLLSLQGNAYIHLPQATKDGSKVFYLGNTLQVWDATTGKRLSSIHDPLWEKNRQIPLHAYLTPDSTQAAILTAGIKNGWPDSNKMTAYLYRLSDSKLLGSFAVKP